jgi:hypothetical protein
MHITKPRILPNAPANFKTAAIVSSILVLPFMILELINRRNIYSGFPIALFVFMWLLPLAFTIILMPILRTLLTENRTVNPISLVPRVALLLLIAWLWVSLVVDQMPCFLGVPNCD